MIEKITQAIYLGSPATSNFFNLKEFFTIYTINYYNSTTVFHSSPRCNCNQFTMRLLYIKPDIETLALHLGSNATIVHLITRPTYTYPRYIYCIPIALHSNNDAIVIQVITRPNEIAILLTMHIFLYQTGIRNSTKALFG